MNTFIFYYSINIKNKSQCHINKVLVETKKIPSRHIKEDILPDFFQNDCPIFPEKMTIKLKYELYRTEQVPHYIINIS